jgi:peptide deformylase
MTILNVLRFPDERLRTKALPVEDINSDVQQIIDDMFETMREENGVGLAATQVNIHQRIVVINVSEDEDESYVLINPEIISHSDTTEINEEG